MGKESIFLENRVELPFVGRHVCDVLPAEDHSSLIRRLKASDNAQGSGLAAAAGPQQRDKFIFLDRQSQIVQDNRAVIAFRNIYEINQWLTHFQILRKVSKQAAARILLKAGR